MKFVKKEAGFTLVEMVITIVIIGVLAAITIPNFKKYQAKAKTVEAKIQLASVYTAQTGFFQLFNMYGTCLRYMGYDSSLETQARYFAIGFPNITANINPIIYNSALGERLVGSECPRDLGEVEDKSFFLAKKAIGENAMDSLIQFQAATAVFSNDLDENLGPSSDEVYSGIGTQDLPSKKAFTAAAAGYIDSTAVDPTTSGLWTINHNKKITNIRIGY